MQHLIAPCKNLGMQRDQANNLPTNNFVYENMNIRITASSDESLLAVTNEKGTLIQSTIDSQSQIAHIYGRLLGHCVLNQYLILFTTTKTESNPNANDYIYKLYKNKNEDNQFIVVKLAEGDYKFSLQHPIETLGYIDTELIQKVYWVDGYNYPRLINIITENDEPYPYITHSQFDFTPEITSSNVQSGKITAQKVNYSGQFKAGVVCYAYTYFNKYGAETNVIDITDINYIALSDRGGNTEETIATAFEVTIDQPNTNFEYVRIYSIIRTSYNGELIVSMIAELPVKKNQPISYIDLNTDHESIDPSYLNYIGGSSIIASTLDFKDDLLFLGDIKIKYSAIDETLRNYIESEWIEVTSQKINGVTEDTFQKAKRVRWVERSFKCDSVTKAYNYFSQINKYSQKDIVTFKRDEVYRFGIQFQDNKGAWTDVIWIGDLVQDNYKNSDNQPIPRVQNDTVYITQAEFILPTNLPENVKYQDSNGEPYINYKICVAETSYSTRTILAQGIVSPTVFNYKERCNDNTFAEASWIYRINNSGMAHKHLQNLPPPTSKYAEIQGITNAAMPPIAQEDVTWAYDVIAFHNYGWNAAGYRFQLFYFRVHKQIENDAEWDSLTTDTTQDNYVQLVAWSGDFRVSAADAQSRMYSFLMDNGLSTDLPSPESVKKRLQAVLWNGAVVGLADLLLPAIGGLIVGPVLQGVQTVRAEIPAIAQLASAQQYDILDDVVSTWEKSGLVFASKEVTKDFIYNGYLPISDSGNGNYPSKVFRDGGIPKWIAGGEHLYSGTNVMAGEIKFSMIKVIPRAVSKATDPALRKKANNYYIDSNILTLNYPEYEDTYQLVHDQKLQFRIVGIAEINNTFSKCLIQAGIGASSDSGIEDLPDMSYTGAGLFNEVLYRDNPIAKEDKTNIYHYAVNFTAYYKIFMWHQENSLIGHTSNILSNATPPQDMSYTPAKLERKVFSNLRQSVNTVYQTDADKYWINNNVFVQIHNSENISLNRISYLDKIKYYQGNYDKVLTFNTDTEYYNPINTVNRYGSEFNPEADLSQSSSDYPLNLNAPVRIKYNSTPHALFALGKDGQDRLLILPRLSTEEQWSLSSIYGDSVEDTLLYGWDSDYQTSDKYAYEIYTENNSVIDGVNDVISNELSLLQIATLQVLYGIEYNAETHTASSGAYDIVLIYNKFDNNHYLYQVDNIVSNSNNSGEVFTSEITVGTNITVNGMWFDYEDLSVLTEIDIPDSQVLTNELTETSVTFTIQANANTKSYTKDQFMASNLYDFIIDIFMQNTQFTDYLDSIGNSAEKEIIKFKVADQYYKQQLENLKTSSSTLSFDFVDFGDTQPSLYNIIYSPYIVGDITPSFNIGGQIYYWFDGLGLISSTSSEWSKYRRAKAIGVKFPPLAQGAISYVQPLAEGLQPSTSNTSYIYIGEFYRILPYNSMYGGYSSNAIKNLKWVESSLSNVIDNATPSPSLIWGDTYYQQWDSLKTYPTTEEDKNSITESLSCMLETHLNLDGRQDVNRGIGNMVNFRPSNTNILNRVYSQQVGLSFKNTHNEDMKDDYFPTEVIWSKPKLKASIVDNWTQFTGSNMLTLDGKYGYLRKLIKINNEIITFQDSGISQIRYNERTQTATQIGVPVEIMNNSAVNGYYQISHNIGCRNKWSIISTASGVFFVDDLNKALYKFNKDGMQNISQEQAFSIWFKENLPSDCIWTPVNTQAFRSFYDNANNDLYLTNNDVCLVYSVLSKSFTSFMSYNGTTLISRVDGVPVTMYYTNGEQYLYEMFAGDYNNFYGSNKEYYIIYRVAPSPTSDCIFTNIEFTADMTNPNTKFNSKGNQINDYRQEMLRYRPFNVISAWNEYQSASKVLNIKYNYDRDISKKFRLWRADIPRAGRHQLERLRNPWIYLKLSKENINNNDKVYNDKFILHDLKVHYYK